MSINVFKVKQQCVCGKGYRSRIDGKCKRCRSKRDTLILNSFWKECEEKNIKDTDYDFSLLRKKYYRGIYEFY